MKRRNLLLGGGAIAALGLTAHSITRGRSYEAAAAEIWAPRARQSMGEFDFLVHHATLAANSHNTQPWMFSGGADAVTIHPDFTRATPAVDPDNHHLFASLGAAAENLSLAASAAGRTSDIAFLADQDVVRIDLGATGAATDPLFDAIVERQCTRSIYDGRQVPAEGLDLITQAAQVPGCSLMLITDKPLMEQVLELIVAANTAQIHDPAFVSELKHWLRFNAGQAVSHRDGLYSACSGNPSLPGWIADLAFGLVFTADAENAKCVDQVRSSAGFAVFFTDRNDAAHWVQAGRSYQRFALTATALGIRHAFLNQPVEVARFRPELAKLLGTGDRRPDLVVRFGYADPMPRSLRRPLGDVIVAA
ncbi:MAG: Tat pathway signal protein [Hoeflea sp.]|uniref:Acg family FMN-binding oxidoreductase n=1 Tax=Hoeflea sp. TaxID=1940281 RepID=UPI00273193D7|nr:Tat pathway signal protein [Hoeflea sp.]MDP2122545.1 Tat pathway signal protein [Hoeflea sp.]